MVTPSSDLAAALLGKTRGAILHLLLDRPDEEFHVRQASRLSGAGLGPVQRELRLLAELGILQRREVGHQVLYQADSSSPVFSELRGLVEKTVGPPAALRETLAALKSHIRVAFIFGSVARGTQSKASDVDVMVIGDASFTDIARSILPVQRRLGREINPTVYPPAEFAEKLRNGHHFLTAVIAQPKVFLIGDENELAGMAKERLDSSARDRARGNRLVAGRGRARPARK